MIIKIPLQCRSKKNSEQIKLYKEFESECGYYLMGYRRGIDFSINLKCTFYVPDKRKRNIVNLLDVIQDILVKYGVLVDDGYDIVNSLNGSKIIYEKGREETIIEIEDVEQMSVDEMQNAVSGIDDAMTLIGSLDLFNYGDRRSRSINQKNLNLAYDKLFKTKKYIQRRIGD